MRPGVAGTKTVGKNMIKECRHNLTACLENFYSGPEDRVAKANASLRPRSLRRIEKTRNEDNNNLGPLHSSVSE